MTENLYETNQFANHTNGTYLFQHSPSALGGPHYGVPNVSSIQSSPISPRLNHEQLTSPATPGHELSPMLEMPNSGGSWEYNQFERTSSWGSSHEELPETSRIYPFNITPQNNSSLNCKDNGSASHHQRLDSFSKAFPVKNTQLLFGDSNRTDEKHAENHISGVLHLPQNLPEGSDRQALESPVFNSMVIQGQCEQVGFHQSESQNPLHGLYQNHQQFHYGYQQHKQKLNNMEQVNRSLQKPQSSWHGYQSQSMSYPMSLNQQQRGMFAHKTHLDSTHHEPLQSPTYDHRQDFKVLEQQIFHYQEQQHLRSLSQPGNPYLMQEHMQSIPAKQNNVFSDARHSAPNTPVFSSPKEDQSSFNFPHRSEDLCSLLYQNQSSGVCKTLPQMTNRGDIFHHLTAHAPQWSQAQSPDIQDEAISPHFRAEPGLSREDGSHAKMRCTVCHREFKSLPALNGHMRSHGGLRTQPTSLKMKDGHIHLSESAQTNPIILPVSVPVKDYPSKLSLSLLCHQKAEEQNSLIKSGTQSPRPSVRKHPSCIKRSVSDGECAPKQVKKRYRHCLVPLMIPPPSAGQESRGAVLFRSQLRTPSSIGDDVPYTPPPMLSPVRPGSGLFSAISGRATGRSSRVESVVDGAGDMDDCSETSREKAVNVTPHINVGEDFQAKIPNINSQPLTEEDTHNAVLLWSPTKDMDTPDNQQNVDDLLKLACSSVLPGGGANTEYVLHCLFECRGDIMNTLEKLLLPMPQRNSSSPKTDYHYAGSDRWTLQEKRQLNKALLMHSKDFYLVQRMVKTKSVSQCVEYYYTWKKRLRIGTRVSTALSTPVQGQRGDWPIVNITEPPKEADSKTREAEISENSSSVFVCEVSNSQINEETWTQNNLRLLCSSPAENKASTLTLPLSSASVRSSPSNSTTSGDTDSAVVFPCTECGKVFLKVKSRNAHMKTHRQQEDTQLWHFPRHPEQAHVMVTPECPVTSLKQSISLHSLTCYRSGEVKASLNDMCSESVQEIDCSRKTLAALHSPLDYISS